MKKILFVIGTIGCFLMLSCENQNTEETERHVEAETHDEHHEMAENHAHENEAHEHEALSLNNGEKWAINEEMQPHVLAQEELIKEYIASQSDDHKTLADQMIEENTNLINSCTMEGESHDELHKWLHPHMELLDALKEAESEEKAEEKVNEIEQSFVTFHEYFQ